MLSFLKRKKEEEVKVEDTIQQPVIFTEEIKELSTAIKELSEKVRTFDERLRKVENTVSTLRSTVEVNQENIQRILQSFDKLVSIYELVASTVNPFIEVPQPKEEKVEIKKEEITETKAENILPLDEIKKDPIFVATVLGWLNYLVEKAGVQGAKRALEYYKEIGWITEKVYIELLKYLKGFHSEKEGILSPEDHIVSLYFITKLKKGIADNINFKKIYEEIIEKGIKEPELTK